jgi:hypothetical protein
MMPLKSPEFPTPCGRDSFFTAKDIQTLHILSKHKMGKLICLRLENLGYWLFVAALLAKFGPSSPTHATSQFHNSYGIIIYHDICFMQILALCLIDRMRSPHFSWTSPCLQQLRLLPCQGHASLGPTRRQRLRTGHPAKPVVGWI